MELRGDIFVESINRIVGLAESAQGHQRAHLFPVAGYPRDRFLIETAPGTLVAQSIPRGPVLDKAGSIDGLCQQINAVGSACRVYVGDKVRVVWDDDRRDAIEMGLPYSEPFKTLSTPGDITGLTPKDLVWLLRTTFKGTFPDPTLLPTLRNLKFTASSEGEANIQHGKESMGRKIDAQVTGAETLPEEIVFTVPVYSDLPAEGNVFTGRVACALDIDLSDQEFALKPLPDEIAVARRSALEWLCKRIRERCETATVFECSHAG